MRLLRAITEDEMVAVFLQTEIHSARFAPEILRLMERDGLDRALVETPDVSDADANARRMRLLGEFRGYRRNAELFEGFPKKVDWYRVLLDRDELLQVRYIDYSFWNVLSNETRLPTEAAKQIRAGIVVFGQRTESYLRRADELRAGARFPDLILTATSFSAPRVVMEGHVRLTTYALAPESLPDEIEVILGISPDFAQWGAHGTP